MGMKLFVFECSDETYLSCIEKNVFGSNLPWPLQVAKGDYCLLHHYGAGALFALWQASSNGGKNLVPKAWGGRFPYQVKVALLSPTIVEVPKEILTEFQVDPAIGRFDNLVDSELALRLLPKLEVIRTTK